MVVGGRELIDTLWNVNTIDVSLVVVRTTELIDTLWNVNLYNYLMHTTRHYGINRYIMECKFNW